MSKHFLSLPIQRPYVRIYWNMIQLFTLNELPNREISCLDAQYPTSTVSCAPFKLKSFTNYAYCSRDLHLVLPRIFLSQNSISSVVYRVSQKKVSIKTFSWSCSRLQFSVFEFIWIQYICKFCLVYHLKDLGASRWQFFGDVCVFVSIQIQ